MGPYTDERFAKHIDKAKVSVAMEIGSNHAIDAINLKKFYEPDSVYVFEADHRSIQICRHNLDGAAVHWGVDGIELITAAAWDEAGVTEFFSVTSADGEGKPEMSSCLPFSEDGMQEYSIKPKRIIVPSVRIDRFCEQLGIERIDLVCMDVEGGTLQVLKGFGDRLGNVRYIISELLNKPLSSGNTPRVGEALADEVTEYLAGYGFELTEFIEVSEIHGDYLFVNRQAAAAA